MMSLKPLGSVGSAPNATQLYVRYAPQILAVASSPEEITDTIYSRNFDPNKLTLSNYSFTPKFSLNPNYPVSPGVSPDQDGYLPFSLGSLGFATPFMGSLQYYQDQTGTTGEKCWQLQWTFYLRCTFSV